jgi:ribosomal protein S18 acetylase RimI-like enzyme
MLLDMGKCHVERCLLLKHLLHTDSKGVLILMNLPTMSLVIRRAHITDWPHLRRVVRSLFSELNEADVSYLLRHHHHGTVVACEGRNVIGFYQIYPRGEPGGAWLNYIGVLPVWRGHGVADALLSFCERHAKTCGFASIALDSFKDNVRSHRFYERNGYVRLVKQDYAGGAKFYFTKSLAQTPALALAMPSLDTVTVLTRVLRKLSY